MSIVLVEEGLHGDRVGLASEQTTSKGDAGVGQPERRAMTLCRNHSQLTVPIVLATGPPVEEVFAN